MFVDLWLLVFASLSVVQSSRLDENAQRTHKPNLDKDKTSIKDRFLFGESPKENRSGIWQTKHLKHSYIHGISHRKHNADDRFLFGESPKENRSGIWQTKHLKHSYIHGISHRKHNADVHRLDLWYISEVNGNPIDLFCHGTGTFGISYKITCPEIDDQTTRDSNEKQKSDKNGYITVKRTVFWNAIKERETFSCICQGWLNSKLIINSNVVKVKVERSRVPIKTSIRKRACAKKFIRLKRNIFGGPTVHVDWYKNGKFMQFKINGTTRIDGVTYQKGKHGLKISRADVRGSGNYTLFVWNLAGNKSEPTYEVSIYEVDLCSSNPCHPNATCIKKSGSYLCLCKTGFFGNGRNCTAHDDFPKRTVPGNVTSESKTGFIKKGCNKGFTTNDTCEGMAERKGKKPFHQIFPVLIATIAALIVSIVICSLIYKRYRSKMTMGITAAANICNQDTNDDNFQSGRQSMPNSVTTLEEINERGPLQFDECPLPKFSSTFCSADNSNMSRTHPNKATDADTRYFGSSTIDHNGGEITLNDIGIKLIIPQGALPPGKTEEIYIRLMENGSDLPHLQEKQSLISHVIKCGPPGLTFEKHVMLIFPHYAAIQNGINGFKILSCEDKETKWEAIFDADEDPSEECFCSIYENTCFLSVLHFTEYVAVGECNGKLVHILAYSSKFIFPKEYCNVRVHCFPDFKYEDCRKRIQEDEKEIDGKRYDAVRPLLFIESGGGLCLTIKDIDSEWTNVYENTKDIGHGEIWKLSTPVSQTFTLKSKHPEAKMCSCRIDVVQKEIETPVISTITLQVPASTIEQGRNSLQSMSSGYTSSEFSTSTNIRIENMVIPPELRTHLSHALDGEDRIDGKDWRMLAAVLKVEDSCIKWLVNNRRIDSPTVHILQIFGKLFEKEPMETQLRRLGGILDDMGRNDAAELVWEYLSTNEDGR